MKGTNVNNSLVRMTDRLKRDDLGGMDVPPDHSEF